MAQSRYACFGCRCDHKFAGLVLVVAGQDGRFQRVWAERHEQFVEHPHTAQGEFPRSFDGKLVDLGIPWYQADREVAIAVLLDLRSDCADVRASTNPDTAIYRVPG